MKVKLVNALLSPQLFAKLRPDDQRRALLKMPEALGRLQREIAHVLAEHVADTKAHRKGTDPLGGTATSDDAGTSPLGARMENLEATVAALNERLDELESVLSEQKEWRYRGVYVSTESYRKSNSCTHAGSLWIATEEPRGSPPGNGWTLACKRGVDGRDKR